MPRRRPSRHRKSSLWRRRREDPHTHRRAKLLAQPAALLPGATLETEPLRCGPVPAAVEPAREGAKLALRVALHVLCRPPAPAAAGGHNTIQRVHDPRFDYRVPRASSRLQLERCWTRAYRCCDIRVGVRWVGAAMDALAKMTASMPAWAAPLIATACIMPVMTQVWPLKQALAMSAIARGSTPPTQNRPKPLSDGKNKPSWGPLTFAGIKGMHYGDLFYAACGLMIYYCSWPDPNVAKDWPALDAGVVHSWPALVLARNLVLEVSFYEFWHQLLFGMFANEAVTKHRYSEGSPYETKPGAKRPQMNVWRERFWCTCGFICAHSFSCTDQTSFEL